MVVMAYCKLGLGGIQGSMDLHGLTMTKYASSRGFFHVKSPTITKVNAAKLGIHDCSMLSLKPTMMLDLKKRGLNIVSDLGLGGMVLQDGYMFRQKFRIRSYEIGPDLKASVETLMHYLQETSTNHLKEIGLMDDSLKFTPQTSKKNLTWVMTKMQMVVDCYPTWGGDVQIDTWIAAYGKNSMCSRWTFFDCETGEILVRGSSILVMMNKETRKLSRFPNEVRTKLEQYFVDTPATIVQDTRKWLDEDDNMADHVRKGLTPRWSDLDVNQHVNNGKYIGLILESVPKPIIEKYEVASMTLDYYRECTKESVLQSQTCVLANDADGEVDYYDDDVDCQHVLRLENGGSGSAEIMKGRTRWRPKYRVGGFTSIL